jgi:predicted ribosome quality control (RQC) complex YloA/Tae2 family protein
MTLTATDIAAVLDELAPLMVGGRIQKIAEPIPDVVTLDIRIPGQTLRLLISVHPETSRIHLVTQRYTAPLIPPPFCRWLRARLLGGEVLGIRQIPNDRIVRVDLRAGNDSWGLVAELMGKQADLLVLDGEDRILLTLHRADRRVGAIYQAPPSRTPCSVSLALRAETPPGDALRFPVSSRLEQLYRGREAQVDRETLARARATHLRKSIQKYMRRVEALQGDLTRAAGYELYSRYGELLKGNLTRLTTGLTRLTVIDYFDHRLPELTIPLDPAKTPRANMEDYFSKHRKYLTAQKEIIPRMDALRQDIRRSQAELASIEQGAWQPRSGDEPPAQPRAPKQARSAARGGRFRRFTSSDNLPIYVGRNAQENEELTFHFAHSDDLWLHARGTSGSHVIVRLEKGSEPPPETLKDAATLAVLYSDLKKSGKGEVMYTRRKWVRKAKGQAPGSVTVTQDRSFYVQLDRARLDALKLRSQ